MFLWVNSMVDAARLRTSAQMRRELALLRVARSSTLAPVDIVKVVVMVAVHGSIEESEPARDVGA